MRFITAGGLYDVTGDEEFEDDEHGMIGVGGLDPQGLSVQGMGMAGSGGVGGAGMAGGSYGMYGDDEIIEYDEDPEPQVRHT